MSAVSPLMSFHAAYAAARPRAADVSLTVAGQRPGAASGRRESIEIEWLPWGVAASPSTSSGAISGEHVAGSGPSAPCEIIASFGEVEAEYAAIRRGAGLLDSPHRGTLAVTGKDRIEFLNRMVTQELKGLAAVREPAQRMGGTREAFWLNRKGRIDADLFIIDVGGESVDGGSGDRTLIELDIANAAGAAASLSEFIFTEDVEIRDVSESLHQVAVHGRLAREVIAAACDEPAFALSAGGARAIRIDGQPVIIARRDQSGETGFTLIMQREATGGVWEFLLACDHIVGEDKRRVRPIGWHGYNIARIEAGEALFNIDFGPTNLPHQVGELLPRRVSFTKGCYLGQEIVARMQSRGHSKPTLVGLRMSEDLLPIAGAQVFVAPPIASSKDGADGGAGELGAVVGVVTSSTLSPMLGAMPIAFAMLRTSSAPAGALVLVNAEGRQVEATVGAMTFWASPQAVEAKP